MKDFLEGIFRAIGDTGPNPQTKKGWSLTYTNYYIWQAADYIKSCLYPPILALLTTATLTAGAEYVSNWFDTNSYAKILEYITGTVFADVDGTLYIEQSWNGSDVDYSDTVSYTGNSHQKFKVERVARYFRLRYVNGASDQTTFRLGVLLVI